jgi:hypothetical protein
MSFFSSVAQEVLFRITARVERGAGDGVVAS